MIEHNVTWWESEDGKIFDDELKCAEHELNLLYEKSGVHFYIGDKEVKEIIVEYDQTYNEATDIFIDRAKETENKAFCDFVYTWYGWCFVKDAIKGKGTHYKMFWDHLMEMN